jgi:hypothetical protein
MLSHMPASHHVPEHIGPGFAAWWFELPTTERSAVAARRRSATARNTEVSLLGEVKDWVWASLATLSREQRWECLQRYGCILMAQFPQLGTRLNTQGAGLRAWALPIASVQPLPRLIDWDLTPELAPHVMAMAELGLFIAHDFPNLWQRLLSELRPSLRTAVGQLVIDHASAFEKITPVMRKRVLRCWAFAMNYGETE